MLGPVHCARAVVQTVHKAARPPPGVLTDDAPHARAVPYTPLWFRLSCRKAVHVVHGHKLVVPLLHHAPACAFGVKDNLGTT